MFGHTDIHTLASSCLFFIFLEVGFALLLSLILNPWAQVASLPQHPEELRLRACATVPDNSSLW